jgi:23S rRNA (uracil1939-C5)-methyltransferase
MVQRAALGSVTAVIDDALELERFVAGGEALGRGAEGRVHFVRGALPGETVTVTITEQRKDWSRGVADQVLVASADRVEPPCPNRRQGCGGCDWQHLAPAAQLPAKIQVVTDALRRTAREHEIEVTSGASVSQHGYRTTVRVIGRPDGTPGFRMEAAHETAPSAGCLVAAPAIVAMLDRLRLPPGLEVVLRTSVATGERLALWEGPADQVSGLDAEVLTGPASVLHEEVAGHRLRVSADAFFQSGPQAAELLVDAVQRAAPELAEARKVVDAYGGVGLFAVACVPPTASVTVIETSRASVADAKVNLTGRSARIVREEFGRWGRSLGARGRGRGFDVVIADPARSGLGKPGVAAVAAAGPHTLVLVSCDPVSSARDTALLVAAGYRLERIEALDLFPHTHHVETVSRFVRADRRES